MITSQAFALSLLLPVMGLLGARAPVGPAVPASPVERVGIEPETEAASCQFAIRAKNNLSFDVWVELYDSTVRLESTLIPALLRGDKQLKIQNHRIATGKTMDRRYEAAGACGTRRTWIFWVRIGGRDKLQMVSRSTSGTGWRDLIVDLGESSKWGL
jgi:hypothetical protein